MSSTVVIVILIILSRIIIYAYNDYQAKKSNAAIDNYENSKPLLDISDLEKTSEMLDEDLYWSIVQRSIQADNNQDNQNIYLINKIGDLTPKQMIGFRLRTDKLLYDTYNSEMWCAAYIIKGGCSDDSFEYFRNWLISRGKDTYYKAKADPDSLASEAIAQEEGYDFEDFWYVALTAFHNKTGGDLYEYIDYDNFKTTEGNYPLIAFNWEDENPESMKTICPELFKKFWNNWND